MASITTQANGRRTIQFVDPRDGKRRSIRLGKVSKKSAEQFKVRLESLVSTRSTGGQPDASTAAWLQSLPDDTIEKLTRAGLVDPRPTDATLAAFLAEYLDRRAELKEQTKRIHRYAHKRATAFFGADRSIRSITAADARDWESSLLASDYSLATVRKSIELVKSAFSYAVDARMVTENPFRKLKIASPANRSRDYFVTREEANRVLQACPDSTWRAIFALARFGGLRQGEIALVEWDGVLWDDCRMIVPSPKTAHHPGKGARVVPIFPELMPHLEAAFEDAPDGAVRVVERYPPGANLGPLLVHHVRRAGLAPWPKLFHNLRASRQTELLEDFPAHVACAWIGNSQAVALRHYAQVTDEHFAKAVQNAVQSLADTAKHDGTSELQELT